MSKPKQTVLEAVRAMTGFDEVAVEEYFRREITDLGNTRMMRALLFTQKCHEGMPPDEAFKASMGATLGELETCFADGDEESEGND